ncbi:MAG TPA: GAF domain-containing protein [Acidobacteriaceae bacterium]|nr:GAF domain-containing protein [Acidobacteriaceae bacterium]
MSASEFQRIIEEFRLFSETTKDLAALEEFCVSQMGTRLPRYDWVGLYMLNEYDPGVLVLGPFHGASTEHVHIPITQGICGAAVAEGMTVVVDDVGTDPRYLACSLETWSEIVVPIRVNGVIVGEIDVDSHTRKAFGGEDREFLEECTAMIGSFIARYRT